jgi:type III secretion protein J
MDRKKLLQSTIALMIIVILIGCGGVKLYQNLSEEDANEMLVLLNENNINASKKSETRQNEVFWSVIVGNNDVVRARELLMQHNLPRRRELGLTGVYKEKGLIPTPDEQKARYLLALKGEIINSLERIPDVVDADVVLNLPTKNEFATAEEKAKQRPTASIIIKMKPSETGTPTLTEAKVQEFVANSLEGMNPRDVTVVLTYIPAGGQAIRPGQAMTLPPKGTEAQPATPPQPTMDKELVGLKLDAASKERLKIYLLIFFLLLIILSTGLIISIVQGSRMRRRLADLERGGTGRHPAVEGEVMDEGPPRLGEGGHTGL